MSNTFSSASQEYPFLNGGGKCGEVIRNTNWQATAPGPPEQWHDALKYAVNMMLRSNLPILICWSDQYVQFYNDAFLAIDTTQTLLKYIGYPASENYKTIWPELESDFKKIMAGHTFDMNSFTNTFRQSGFFGTRNIEFSASPIEDLDGKTLGMLVIGSASGTQLRAQVGDDYAVNEGVQEQESRLQQILNMLPASVVVIRGYDLIVEMINDTNLQYWNRQRDQVVGRPFLEILPDLADQPFAGQLRHVMATGENIEVIESPVIFQMPNGTQRETYVDYTYQPLLDPNGNRNGVLVMSFEITERVVARQMLEKSANDLRNANEQLYKINHALAASEERFKYLIERAPVAIGVLSGRELLIESANEKILEVWGKTDAIVGMPLDLALPELEGQPFLGLLDNVITSGKPFFANEIRSMLEHQGELKEIFFNLVYQPIKRTPDLVTDILIVAVDVTQEVNARKKIERAEQTLRLALDAADIGTWSFNTISRELQTSSRVNEMYGLQADENFNLEKFIQHIMPEYQQVVLDAVERSIKSLEGYDITYPLQAQDDQPVRWLRAMGSVGTDEDANALRLNGVIMDITDQKLDEMRKNDFIGMVSHELKTPLTSLTAILQLLNRKLSSHDDAFVPSGLEKAGTQVRKMANMINGFLNISRLESGKIVIDKTVFDLSALVSEVIDEMSITVSSHTLQYKNPGKTLVNADRDKIASVITNLVSNAIKYSPQAQIIELSLNMIEEGLCFHIRDFGIGINSNDIQRLFERFYRIENSQTRNISGFGIGLYLSSEIIHRHGGRIWVESEENKGSDFYFSLPLAK